MACVLGVAMTALLDMARQFYVRISALLGVLDEQEQQLEELSIRKHLALQTSNTKKFLTYDRQHKQLQQEAAMGVVALLRWTECETVQDARTKFGEVVIRMAVAQEAYESWRRVVALVEIARALPGGFSEDVPEEHAVGRIEVLEREFQTATAHVTSLLPKQLEAL
jgi:hypothetical protein